MAQTHSLDLENGSSQYLEASDSAIWKAELAANSGWSHSFKTPWFSGEDAADLTITTTAGNCYVTVCGYEV